MQHRSLIALLVLAAATACSNDTTAPKPKTVSQGLWVANGTNVVEFSATQLGIGGLSAPAPALILNSSVFIAPQGVQFDASGNLWVIDGGNAPGAAALYEFTSTQLSAVKTNPASTPTPNVTLKSSAFGFPQQAVFDSKGDLVVTDNMENAVYIFTPSQLAAGGNTIAPTATIIANPALIGPLGLAFDAAGDLWVANNGSTTIVEFSAASIPGSGSVTLTPAVTLSDDGQNSIQAPWALVFDASGDLYSSNANTPFTIVAFAKASLAASGSPVPAITINPTTVGGMTTLAAPNGLAFDTNFDLAVISSATPFGVAGYTKPELGVTNTPSVLFAGAATTLNAPAGDVFGPSH
jgi:hypothetical protein